jgi:hypothetical protein
MTFNPDKYLEKKEAEGFDPDVYLEKTKETPSMGESALRGLAQGASLGFSDELTGAGEATLDAAKNLSLNDFLSNYKKHRDESREANKIAELANPKVSATAEIAGGILPFLTGAGEAGLAANIGTGAAIGASNALGTGEQDSLEESIKDAGMGAGMGAAAGGIGTALGKLLSKLATPAAKSIANKASNLSEEAAASSLGLTKAAAKKMGPDKVRELGNYALENDLVSLNPFKSTEAVSAANEAIQNKAGALIGNTLKKLPQGGIDTNQLSMEVISELQGKFPGQINKSIFPFINDIGADVLQSPSTLEGLQATKGAISQAANWGSIAPSDKSVAAQSAYGILKDNIESLIDKAGGKLNDPELIQKFLRAKKDYGNAASADALLNNKIAGDLSKGAVSLTDKMSGIAGAMSHGTPGGIMATMANKLATKVANPLIAKSSQLVSDVVSGIPQSLEQTTPKIAMMYERSKYGNNDTAKISNNMYKMNNQELSNLTPHLSQNPSTKIYADIINDAVASGNDQRKNAAIFSMMQNPAAREHLKSLSTDEEEQDDNN